MSACNSTESDMFSFLLFIVVWGKPNETVELYTITVTPSPFLILHCDSTGCKVMKG